MARSRPFKLVLLNCIVGGDFDSGICMASVCSWTAFVEREAGADEELPLPLDAGPLTVCGVVGRLTQAPRLKDKSNAVTCKDPRTRREGEIDFISR